MYVGVGFFHSGSIRFSGSRAAFGIGGIRVSVLLIFNFNYFFLTNNLVLYQKC